MVWVSWWKLPPPVMQAASYVLAPLWPCSDNARDMVVIQNVFRDNTDKSADNPSTSEE